MPDDVGGRPFPDGDEPDEHDRSRRGDADEEFASVVFDEDFVRSAPIHEPTAVERMLAAAQAEAARSRPVYGPEGEPGSESGGALDGAVRPGFPDQGGQSLHDPYGSYGGALRPYRSSLRWHRPVAWVLAVVMGIGLVALAFTAVYRGGSGKTQSPAPPPASSGVDGVQTVRPGALPSASAVSEPPPASAVPRTN